MGRFPTRPILRRLFGEEGTVASETELQILIVGISISATGIFVISAIVSDLAGVFGVSEAEAGQLVTAVTAPSILLVPVTGVLADRIGRKPVLIGGLLVFGVAGAAIALTSDFAIILGLRVVQGMGMGAINPVVVTMIGDLYDDSRQTTAQGLRSAGVQTMNLVSPLLAGVLVLASWRYPFLLYLLAVGVAAWAWRALPDVELSSGMSFRTYTKNLIQSLARPAAALIVLSMAVRFFLTFGFLAYVSVLLSRLFNASAVMSGAMVSTYGLVALVTSSQTGRLTAAWNAMLVVAGGFLIGGIGMALMGIGPTFPVVVFGVVLFGAYAGITEPIQKSLVTELAPASRRAGAVSSAFIIQHIGMTAGPLSMGLVIQSTPVTDAFVGFGTAGGILGALLLGAAYMFDTPSESVSVLAMIDR